MNDKINSLRTYGRLTIDYNDNINSILIELTNRILKAKINLDKVATDILDKWHDFVKHFKFSKLYWIEKDTIHLFTFLVL